MPQSFSAVYIHAVFSTKERYPFLRDPNLRQDLHTYLGSISKNLSCPPLRVGGVEDHVHTLFQLSRTISLADWIKETKRVSNQWLKEQDRDVIPGHHQALKNFAWQTGYACFSVSISNIDGVIDYIERQPEHHAKSGYQDELRALLRKHGEDWDEKYLWD